MKRKDAENKNISTEESEKIGDALLALQSGMAEYAINLKAHTIKQNQVAPNIMVWLYSLVYTIDQMPDVFGFKHFEDFMTKYRPELIPAIVQEAGLQGMEKPTLHKIYLLMGTANFFEYLADTDQLDFDTKK